MRTARSTRRRDLVAVAAAALLLLGASACSSDPDDEAQGPTTTTTSGATTTSTSTTVEEPSGPAVAGSGTYAVGARDEVWVDETRPTAANGDAPAKPERTFETLVLYPAVGEGSVERQVVDAEPEPGPWPLVLFSHGFTGQGFEYAQSLRVLASAGYVVVAPDYPLSNRNAEGGATVTDVPTQAGGDVAFIIDEALAASEAGGSLDGLIDPDRIGLAGHSLGAVTSIAAAYDPCCAEARVKAVAEWAGVLVPLSGEFEVDPLGADVPLLIVHGTEDGTVPYKSAAGIYDAVGPPKLEVTLPGEGHIPAFITGLASPASTVVVETTVAFFDAELKDDPEGLERVEAVVDDAGPEVATLRSDLD